MSGPDLLAIVDTLDKLQASTRRTLPIFILGIAATLLAAGVAIYYILTLSADLHDARIALQQSQTALAQARSNLETANASLRQAQKGAAPGADAQSIAAAISDVSRSQNDLTMASSSIKQATTKLSTGAPVREQGNGATPEASGEWFAVVGSYSIDDAGMEKAKAKLAEMEASGLCGEVWQTKISKNYAVVVGTRAGRKAAVDNVNRARKAGIAKDAFPQADRGWTKATASPTCA